MEQSGALIAFGALAVAGLLCADGRQPRIYAVAKPLATLSLLLVAGSPAGSFGVGIGAGLVLSTLGDVALLRKHHKPWFVAGLGFFLLAHASYTAAFLGSGEARPSAATALGATAAALGAAALLRRIWSGVAPSLKVPVVVYGAVISVMLGAASTVSAGASPLDVRAAILGGATLFYLGDAVLALGMFGKPIPFGQTVSMGLYWAGQLGLALAARWQGSPPA